MICWLYLCFLSAHAFWQAEIGPAEMSWAWKAIGWFASVAAGWPVIGWMVYVWIFARRAR